MARKPKDSSPEQIEGFTGEIADFRRYLTAERGLSSNTLEAYLHDIQAFTAFIEISDLKSIETDHILHFLAHLKNNAYAPSSISRALISIKVLFRFLQREKYVEKDIAVLLESPKILQILPEVLSVKETERLLEQPDITTASGACDKAILEMMYGCGLRVSEVCALNLYNVDDEFVRVFGKGKKERIVPVGKAALKAVDYYIANFRGDCKGNENEPLFVNSYGKRVDRITIWSRIKDYAKKAQITKNISPHTLRHAFATHLLDNGADLRVIQEMLGHSDIGSTDRYMHISRKKLQEKFFACHPRN